MGKINSEISVKILLVSHPSVKAYLERVAKSLNEKGWNVDLAFGIEEPFSMIETSHYDLCVVHNRLRDQGNDRDMSHIELIRKVKQHYEWPKFIINSGYPIYSEVKEALTPNLKGESLVIDYVSMHEGIEKLLQSVEKAIHSKASSTFELFSDPQPTQAVIELFSSINAKLIGAIKKSPNDLYHLQPRAFEELVAELLASYGWEVNLTKQTRDGGYDILAIRKDISSITISMIVECKRYRPDRRVGLDIIRSLYGVKADLRVGMAMLATTSYFSKDVIDYKTSRYDFELKDFGDIVGWINEYRPQPSGQLYIKDHEMILP
jgi:HJR/Mrr/RecB family endonuclease